MKDNLILLGEYGSVAQGTATDNSDHDYMGVVVETEFQVIGLEKFDTKRVSDAKQGEKSKAGESDTTYHGLRKFASLAAAGNPTVGGILHLPEYQVLTQAGYELVHDRDLFWSKRAGFAYLGYLNAQIRQMVGVEGKNPKRPEVVEQFGYDVKFAYHAYRLGVQGYQYMEYQHPFIPMLDDSLSYAKSIRAGEVSYDEVMSTLGVIEGNLRSSLDRLDIPDQPDYDGINRLLVSIHSDTWNQQYYEEHADDEW